MAELQKQGSQEIVCDVPGSEVGEKVFELLSCIIWEGLGL